MSNRLNFPIWADADTTSTGFTLQHLVNGSWVNTDMRTCALPAGYTNEVCLSRYIEKDIKSTAPNLNVATGITPQPDAYQVYRMVLDGVETRELGFFNDWSYEMFTGDTRCISAPINRHADSRQHLLYGNFAETGNSIVVREMIRAEIKMQPNTLSIGAEAEGHTITAVITSNTYFELILPEWLTASQTAFTSGTTVVYLYPQNNTSFDSRQFTIQAKHDAYWSPDYEYTDLAQVAQSGKVAYLTITPDPLGIPYSGGSTYVTVYTNTDFTATTNSSDTWLTYSGKTEVGVNYYDVYFNVSANTGDYRQTHVYFEYVVDSSGGTQTRASRVVQAKAPDITIEPQSKEIAASAQSIRIQVSSDTNWVASTASDWLTVPSSGVSGVTLIFINADSNISAESRSASVIFSNGVKQTTFNILQSASTNTIRYTSTDDAVIVPKYTTGFGATYVDSVYYPEYHVGYLLFESEPTSIGVQAFESKGTLASIIIPDSVTSIGSYAFYECASLSSATIGSGVTSIGNYAFGYCESLSSITMPNSVTSIGGGAFEWCKSLSSITIPDSVTLIRYRTFNRCTSLSSITIPNSVTSIGTEAFFTCTPSLSSVTIGSGVTSIGGGAFEYCRSLSSIVFSGTMAQWNSITKGSSWHGSVPATVVHCTNGDVPI